MSSAPTRTVLVTGAARRLGREIALGLAAWGWQVAVHFRGSADDATKTIADCAALTRAAAGFQADLGLEDEARALVPRVVAHFGQLDAVVNSASLFEHDDVTSFSYSRMDAHWRTNTAAAIVLAQALHTHVAARGATGAVVVIPLLFMGSLLTESFFGIPGLGSYTIEAIQSQDFAVVRAMVFIGSGLYIVGLLLTDLSYTLVDPRIRFQ